MTIGALYRVNIYIVGTNHSHQLIDYDHGDAQKFAQYLSTVCESKSIDFVAEELNEESIALWEAKGSTARLVSLRFSIPHKFCDPDSKQRKKIGILSDEELKTNLGFGKCLTEKQSVTFEEEKRKTWPIRENFWLESIRNSAHTNCLFIVGKNHVQSFSRLLSSQGYAVEILNDNWEP